MPRVSYAFFSLAGMCGLAGMSWGIWMGIAGDHSSAPAHAHLNLLGWLGLAVMGTFHALAETRVPRPLAWTNFILSGLGAITMPVGIALIVYGHAAGLPLAVGGGLIAWTGMLSFVVAVLGAAGRIARP